MRISIKKATDCLLCVAAIIVTNIFFTYFNEQHMSIHVWQRNISVLTIIFIIISLFIVKSSYSFLSIPVLFILLSYLFHFGQVIINGLISNYKYSVAGNFISMYEDEVVKEAVYYSFLTIQFVVLGIIIGTENRKYDHCIRSINQDIECKRIAKLILYHTVPFKIGIMFIQFLSSYKYGYASASGIKLSSIKGYGIVQTFADFYVVGVFLLLCYYRNSLRSFQKVYIISCMIGILSMFGGSRSKGVLDIICFTAFYFLLSCRIDKRKILKLSVLGFIVGVITIVIAETRLSVNGVGISVIYTHMINMIRSNRVIGNALEEFGGTVSSILKVVEQENIYYSHQYGISYIKGIIGIFPNIGYDVSKLHYTNYLNQNVAMGGSYIAEFYFNFGKHSYIFGAVIGIAVVRVYDGFVKCIKHAKYIRASYFVPVIYFILFLPRDYLPSIYRPVVWGFLIVFLLHIIRV